MLNDFFKRGVPVMIEPDIITLKKGGNEYISIHILASRLVEDGKDFYIFIKGEPGVKFYSS